MASLRDKIVFITGASSGIGKASALAFAREGAKLLLCARRVDLLEQLKPQLLEAGAPAVHAFSLDVSDPAAVESTLKSLPEPWREIAVLLNNAGLSRGLVKVYEQDPR